MSANGSSSHVRGERVSGADDAEVFIDRSALRGLSAGQATFDRSAVGVARFDQGTIRQSMAGAVISRSVACDEVRTVFLVSPVVRGEVRTLVDIRTAIAIGFGMALGKALLSGLRWALRRLF